MNRETAIQLALFGVAAIAAYWFVIRPASKVVGAIGDAYSPGGVAYNAGDTIQDALVPGVDSLGTWLYDLFHDDSELFASTTPAAAAPKPGPAPSYDYGFGAGTGPLRLPVGTAGVADGYSVFWGT